MERNKQNLPKLRRDLIEENTVDYYRTAGGTRPDLRVVDLDGRRLIVKDFKRSDFLFRVIVGPILIRREYGAMRKLTGVEGIPQIVGKLDLYALAMEHIEGKSLEHVANGTLTNDFYTKLRVVIDDMHAKGVGHCDLRSRGNVMLADDGSPWVVDFAACVFYGRGINPFFRWLFHQFVLADNNAILRIKNRLSPELMSDSDHAELEKPLPFERQAKKFGETVRNLTRRFLTKGS